MTTVVISLLGTRLDAGRDKQRWERWRPTVALCQHEDFEVDRLELLHPPGEATLLASLTSDIASVSPRTQVVPRPLAIANPWDFAEVFAALSEFADGYPFDPERNDYYLHITTGTHVAQICLFMLCETRAIPGRLLQTSPPRGRVGSAQARAIGSYDIIDLDLARYDRLAARFAAKARGARDRLKAGIATRNAPFNDLIDRLEQVASRCRDPILLGGETGTGKSALAERIYQLQRTAHGLAGDFVPVNCATLRGDTAASALFGHTRGAFTGAGTARAGLLRAADGGTLFLDEIGELGPDEQAMLLRALETGRFLPVGADAEVRSRFLLIAGTNRDLRAEVRAGRFREDLLARIALWSFELPPLRARREDLAPNLDYELERLSTEHGRRVTMNASARAAFLAFATGPEAPWRGNFRDFAGAIRRMATLCTGGRIADADVTAELARLRATWAGAPAIGDVAPEGDRVAALLGPRAASLDRFDRVQLADVLTVCATAPSLAAAGRTLFASSLAARTSRNDADRLRKYLARFGLSAADVLPHATP
jgi:transcriptional regulatory protein RtcR